MKLPPIDDVVKALKDAGLGPDDIAKALDNMGLGGGDNVASKVGVVVPKLVAEGEALPAAVKMAAATKKTKFVRPAFDDVVHAKTTEKFSDIMSAEEFAAAKDADLSYLSKSKLNAANNEELRLAGRARSAEKSAANKAAHAATRTPEARRKAAANRKEYFDKLKKEDK